MSIGYNPRIITDRLALCADALNQKSHNPNLVTSIGAFNYTFSNQILPTELDVAPNGKLVLCRHNFTGSTSPFMQVRADRPLPQRTYTISAWIKATENISANFRFIGETPSNIPSMTTISITTQWQRFSRTFTTTMEHTAARIQLFFGSEGNDKIVSIWGVELIAGTQPSPNYIDSNARGINLIDVVKQENFSLNNLSLYSYDSTTGSILFNREELVKNGSFAITTGSNDLTAANYLLNDHTTEVWIKPNNRNPTNIDGNGTETQNAIVVYKGFHSMWYYNATAYTYTIWGQSAGTNVIYNLGFGDTNVNTWVHLVAVRNGSSLTLYRNGIQQNAGTITSGNDGTPSTNELRIGSGSNNSNFSWHSNMNFGVLRMYKKALTLEEITQNFNANRGRFGI
jgi:hypothetical protein